MSKSRTPKQPPARPSIDAAAPGVALVFLGGRTGRYVPARDLEGSDVARIAFRRASDQERRSRPSLVRPGEKLPPPKRPGQPSADAIHSVAEELVATGRFAWATDAPEGVRNDEPVSSDTPTENAAEDPAPAGDEPASTEVTEA